ncbi:MAG: DUF4274 domain-containing protein [Clostridiales bacterium]|nr:DUF4274 domain-containing protein [Clostridiales bacterium]
MNRPHCSAENHPQCPGQDSENRPHCPENHPHCPVDTITDSVELHHLAQNHNWDDGFALPAAIANNPFCDLGTALTLFYLADGYSFLEQGGSGAQSGATDQEAFVGNLYNDINEGRYTSNEIYFCPPLTKTQIYKLKKTNPDINELFFLEQGDLKVEA